MCKVHSYLLGNDIFTIGHLFDVLLHLKFVILFVIDGTFKFLKKFLEIQSGHSRTEWIGIRSLYLILACRVREIVLQTFALSSVEIELSAIFVGVFEIAIQLHSHLRDLFELLFGFVFGTARRVRRSNQSGRRRSALTRVHRPILLDSNSVLRFDVSWRSVLERDEDSLRISDRFHWRDDPFRCPTFEPSLVIDGNHPGDFDSLPEDHLRREVSNSFPVSDRQFVMLTDLLLQSKDFLFLSSKFLLFEVQLPLILLNETFGFFGEITKFGRSALLIV